MSEEELKPHLNPHSLLTDPVDVFDVVAIPVPPGTKAPPRPPGKERVPVGDPSAAQIATLVTRIESALQTIHEALAQIKQLQGKAG